MPFWSFLYRLCLTLWVGGMWVVGYVVAPVLFAELSDTILAGNLAGKMFTWMARIGLVCGAYLLLYLLVQHGWSVVRRGAFWLVLFMLLGVAAGHFGIQPIIQQLKEAALPAEVMKSVLRDRFATWHGISSILYLLQSLFGLALLWQNENGVSPKAGRRRSV